MHTMVARATVTKVEGGRETAGRVCSMAAMHPHSVTLRSLLLEANRLRPCCHVATGSGRPPTITHGMRS